MIFRLSARVAVLAAFLFACASAAAADQILLRAKALLDGGAIGRVLEVKMRAAHAGPLAPGVKHPGPNIKTVSMTGREMASTWWHQTAAGGGG